MGFSWMIPTLKLQSGFISVIIPIPLKFPFDFKQYGGIPTMLSFLQLQFERPTLILAQVCVPYLDK